MRHKILLQLMIGCLVCLVHAGIADAAGIIMRVQQMKQARQNPQGMTQEQYQQYQQSRQSNGQNQGQQAAPPPTYQQTVDARNQAIAQAIIDANKQSQSSESVAFGNNTDVSQFQGPNTATAAVGRQRVAPPSSPPVAQDVVDLAQVWKKLDNKSTVWSILIDDQSKILTVAEYIDRFRKEGVTINGPPAHYVQVIDQMAQANPQMLERPFGDLVRMAAIVEYDFDNGMDKDALARQALGDAGFEANKKRFTSGT